jgi:hypothetical protein
MRRNCKVEWTSLPAHRGQKRPLRGRSSQEAEATIPPVIPPTCRLRLLNRFGDFWGKPLPDGRGSETGVLISQGLPSRAQRAPRERAEAFPNTVKRTSLPTSPFAGPLGRFVFEVTYAD